MDNGVSLSGDFMFLQMSLLYGFRLFMNSLCPSNSPITVWCMGSMQLG